MLYEPNSRRNNPTNDNVDIWRVNFNVMFHPARATNSYERSRNHHPHVRRMYNIFVVPYTHTQPFIALEIGCDGPVFNYVSNHVFLQPGSLRNDVLPRR